MQKFTISEAVQYGWDTVKNNLGFFIIIMIIAGVINSVPESIANILEKKSSFLSFIVSSAGWVLWMIVQMGLIKITLKFINNEKAEFNDLFAHYHLFFNYIIGSIIYGVLVSVGLMLFVVPGVWVALKFQFYSYYIVDKEMGPIDALKKSAELTDGIKMDLLVLGLALLGINFIGAIAFGIGLLITVPITMLAYVYVYHRLAYNAYDEESVQEW